VKEKSHLELFALSSVGPTRKLFAKRSRFPPPFFFFCLEKKNASCSRAVRFESMDSEAIQQGFSYWSIHPVFLNRFSNAVNLRHVGEYSVSNGSLFLNARLAFCSILTDGRLA